MLPLSPNNYIRKPSVLEARTRRKASLGNFEKQLKDSGLNHRESFGQGRQESMVTTNRQNSFGPLNNTLEAFTSYKHPKTPRSQTDPFFFKSFEDTMTVKSDDLTIS